MKKLVTLLIVGLFLGLGGEARADRVSRLIKSLKTNPSPKVRLVAALQLGKYPDPRVVRALMSTLRNSSEDPKVKGWAALGLGRLRVMKAVSLLRKAARSSDPFLKSKAASALERLCPSRLSGKRFYLNLDKARGIGPLKHLARGLMVVKVSRILARRRDVVTGWPRCKTPSGRALKRKRMQGFYMDMAVKVQNSGGQLSCKIQILFTTFPGKSIKGSAGAKAAVPGSADAASLSHLIGALVNSLKGDIDGFLNRQ